MAKKKKVKPEQRSAVPVKKQEAKINEASAPIPWYRIGMQLGLVISVIVITAICFSPVLSSTKEFINFDDPVYITSSDLVTKLDAKHIKIIFSGHDPSLNYHPLTILSLAINYSFSQLNPLGYFITNLTLHLLNTFLVFIFLYRLSGRKFWVGLIAAALFGIHPMHVESVAWASERKDLLYCFFFLASCITYLIYIETKKISYLVFCFVLFILSCLSKAMAVPLPMVLLLIDYYRQRKFTVKTIAEKIPFFLLALIIGYFTVKIQAQGAIAVNVFGTVQRIMFASYGFIMYFEKLLLPIRLSAFYPYPTLNNGDVPLIYKLAPVIALAIIIIPLFLSFKKSKESFRTWLFGIGFFILMIALVLQFLSVGAAIMADRYSYISYIGIFFIIASLLNKLIEKKNSKTATLVITTSVVVLLAVSCYARVKVWQNDEILWSDVIEKYPYITEAKGDVINVLQQGVNIAYDNRANYYRLHGDMDKAFADYDLMARFGSKSEGVYNNLGNIYSLKAQEAASKGDKALANDDYLKAINMYTQSINLKPGYIDAIYNRGIAYSTIGDHKKALEDYNTALQLNPPNFNAILASAANEKLLLGMYTEGIDDCTRALAANPNDVTFLYYRGTAYVNLGKYKEAIDDLSRAVSINPALGNIWYNLSFAYNKINDKQKALEAALNAKKNGFAVPDQYLEGLRK